MDFCVYSRDVPGTALRDDLELLEEHWSYMDGFAGSMIARGPTLTDDRETAMGSIHILGLPGVAAAREFVDREPNNRAGVYADHSIWRFDNLLGRTMWEFQRNAEEPRFLVFARLDRGVAAARTDLPMPAPHLPDELRDRLILYGALRELDAGELVGVVLAVQALDRNAVGALLDDARAAFDAFPDVEILSWEFGGRR